MVFMVMVMVMVIVDSGGDAGGGRGARLRYHGLQVRLAGVLRGGGRHDGLHRRLYRRQRHLPGPCCDQPREHPRREDAERGTYVRVRHPRRRDNV